MAPRGRVPRGTPREPAASPARAAGPLALFAAEWRKIQRTWVLPLTVLGPLGVTLMGVIYYFLRPEYVRAALAGGAPRSW